MKKEKSFTYTQVPNRGDLNAADLDLLEIAEQAVHTAYAPYSDFKVGVALRLENGLTVRGSNQENAAFPMCVCGEQVALAHAGSNYPGIAVISMAIAAQSAQGWNGPLAPCGACRQIIAEHEKRGGKAIRLVLLGGKDEVYIFEGVSPLLPFAFDDTYF
ncbi:MAG: cytidine deaminase [Saprospiraceae bacterium]